MKYLKLFENFNEPDIEDAKWIIIRYLGEVENIEIDPKWNAKNLLSFVLLEKPTRDEIINCREHLKEEGFFLTKENNKCIVGVGNSVKEYCINWLKENFSDMDVVDSKDNPGNILYRYTPKDNIINYKPEDKLVYINYNRIWSFLNSESCFNLEDNKVYPIISEWLNDVYKLSGLKTIGISINPTDE